jgi:hypothetical protein
VQAAPADGSCVKVEYWTAICRNCGERIRSVAQIDGITGLPYWTHQNGRAIPNYDCTSKEVTSEPTLRRPKEHLRTSPDMG